MSAPRFCPRCGALNTPEATDCFACGQALSDAAASLLSASESQVLLHQRYRRLRRIGTGGFGAVYKAEDTQLGNRLVAIKEMSARGLTSAEQAEATTAFYREALLLAKLAHPHLPRIYEQFEEQGHLYLVMDFIEGQTLEDYLKHCGGSLPVKEALQLGVQLTEVLGYLHTRQPPIIFRDLKPSNVMRAPDGQVYLIDFGIARLFKPGQSKDTIAFGSPGYAAPEQYGKAQTTPRSDIYSLGALLHHLITGRDPSDNPFRFAPLSMRRPMGLSTLLQRMVEMDPEKRPASMEVVRRDLEGLLSPQAPWHGDNPALTGAYPRVTSTFAGSQSFGAPPAPQPTWRPSNTLTSPQPFGAPLAAPTGAPPAWPQQPIQTMPPQSSMPPARKKRRLGWIPGLFWLAVMVIFFTLNHQWNQSTYSGSPDGSGNAPSPTTPPAVPVYALAWSPDGTKIASAGKDSTIQVWDVANPEQVLSITTDFSYIYPLAWSPDGKYIAATGDKNEYQVWKADGTPVGTYPVDATINGLAWSPDSQYLALACSNTRVEVVNALTGTTSVTYTGHTGDVQAVAWSPDGKYLVSGGNDGPAQVWELATAKTIYTYQHKGTITALAWSPDGSRIVSGDANGQVVAWDAMTGHNALTYASGSTSAQNNINALAWSPDGKYLAAGSNADTVPVWASSSGSLVYAYSGHSDSVETIAWSPVQGQQRIASGSDDGTVQVWDALTGQEAVTYRQP